MHAVEPERYDTAKGFLANLRKSHPDWSCKNQFESGWIFRGQSDSKWNLQPRAWPRWNGKEIAENVEIASFTNKEFPETIVLRPTFLAELHEKGKSQSYVKCLKQAWAEASLVSNFAIGADDLGLLQTSNGKVDRYDKHQKDIQTAITEYGVEANPWNATLNRLSVNLYALAQHHKVPTRLLDWTRKPEIAAFFAVQEIVQSMVKDVGCDGEIAVWALNWKICRSEGSKIVFHWCTPRSEFQFLHAQDSLFTHLSGYADRYFIENEKWPDFIEQIPNGAVRLLTLSVEEAPELARLLHEEKVTRATLMPTLDNVSLTQDLMRKLNRL